MNNSNVLLLAVLGIGGYLVMRSMRQSGPYVPQVPQVPYAGGSYPYTYGAQPQVNNTAQTVGLFAGVLHDFFGGQNSGSNTAAAQADSVSGAVNDWYNSDTADTVASYYA